MTALIFMASEDLPVPADEIDDDEKREKQREFRERVSKMHFEPSFKTEADLSMAVVAALHATPSAQEPTVRAPQPTMLLFPYVTNQAGFDTAIAISNTSARPRTNVAKDGVCTLYYYASTPTASLKPTKQVSDLVHAGQQLLFVLSSPGTHGLFATPGFQGYIIAECNFPNAKGFTFITDGPIGQAMSQAAIWRK
jgi:hypothetical protein